MKKNGLRYDDSETCGQCGITSPRKYVRRTILHGKRVWLCVDERACERAQEKKYPLPEGDPLEVEKATGLVLREHVETDKRALVEKERLRAKDLKAVAQRKRGDELVVREMVRLFERERGLRPTQKGAKA